jgi:hypothetical protein
MKHNFDKTCPLCHSQGTAETTDSRNMFYCVVCGFNTPLITLKQYEPTEKVCQKERQ